MKQFILKSNNRKQVMEQVKIETYSFRSFCESCGYEVWYGFWKNGSLCLGFSKNSSNKYLPEISLDVRKQMYTKEISFSLHTFSCGAVSGKELEEWYKAQTSAMSLITFLSNYDYSVFPEIITEEE